MLLTPAGLIEALKIKNIRQKRLIFISKISYKLHSKMILLPISYLGIESLRNFFQLFIAACLNSKPRLVQLIY